MARTKDKTIYEVTQDYLSRIDPQNPPSPDDIEGDILEELKQAFDIANQVRPKGEKWRLPDRLSPAQIADILLTLYPIVSITCAGTNTDRSYDLLSIYQSSGEQEGIYVSTEHTFHLLARQYCYNLTTKETNEVMAILKDKAPQKTRCEKKNLIAVNNGIFDYDTKQLLPFSPDYIFIAKSKVNYNPQAQNIIIHNDEDQTDWDVESWMEELFDDPEIQNTIWQIIGAIIRPNVHWGISAWFYSNTGNNGKGTLCELMRAISGEGTYASIPLSDFSKDFMLEPLTRASSIIVDENDVGTYIDKAANLKAIITNDVIQMNRKFKTPIAYQFKGFMVQCLNEMPRIKDKSDSFYRRQLFIPFTKCFTGKERKYIKQDYLHRSEVLEYIMYKVLNMNYYNISIPEACKEALEEYKEYNDPIRQFAEDIFPSLKWGLVPFSFLYDLYKSWMKRNSPNGSIQGRNTFINDIIALSTEMDDWYCPGKQTYVRRGNKMDRPEPLILEYNLEDWKNKAYRGNDLDRVCQPMLKSGYRGLLRYDPGDPDQNNEEASN